MRTQRPTPFPGLLAGLLALVVFASVAVAMTAGGSSTPTPGTLGATPATSAQVDVNADSEASFRGDNGRDGGRRDGGRGGRGR